jgi:hypothetical protein
MVRTKGTTNKTSREKRAEAKSLLRDAKLGDRIGRLEKKVAQLSKKRR